MPCPVLDVFCSRLFFLSSDRGSKLQWAAWADGGCQEVGAQGHQLQTRHDHEGARDQARHDDAAPRPRDQDTHDDI